MRKEIRDVIVSESAPGAERLVMGWREQVVIGVLISAYAGACYLWGYYRGRAHGLRIAIDLFTQREGGGDE